MKPARAYHVAIYSGDQRVERCAIYGATFFEARARLCVAQPNTEPGDVRLDPPRQFFAGSPE